VAANQTEETTMPTLVNYTEHPFQFPMPYGEENPVTKVRPFRVVDVPRAKIENDGQGVETHTPSRVVVTDEVLRAMKESPVAKSWFVPSKDGKLQLVVEGESAPAPKVEAKK
jgi:hypothetical protein